MSQLTQSDIALDLVERGDHSAIRRNSPYLYRGANDWLGNGEVAGLWTTMKLRFAAS